MQQLQPRSKLPLPPKTTATQDRIAALREEIFVLRSEMAYGKTLMQARSYVAKNRPGLHDEYLARVNSQPEQRTTPIAKSAYWSKVDELKKVAKPDQKRGEANKQFPELCETA